MRDPSGGSGPVDSRSAKGSLPPRVVRRGGLPDASGRSYCGLGLGTRDDSASDAAADEILQWQAEHPHLLNRALRDAGTGMYLQDYRAGFIRWSPALYEIFGVPSAEVLTPETFLAAIHPEDVPGVMAAAQAVHTPQSGRESYELSFRILRRNGEVRWIEAAGYLERDDHGHVVREVGITRDVTDRYRLESQLHASQRLQLVGRLAGGVAHDFNNLLTAIIGEIDLAVEHADPQTLRQALGAIEKTANRAATLTRQLLSFSRHEVARLSVVDLNEILIPIQRMLRRLLSDEVELVMDLCAEGWAVRVDPGQIEQILVNLVVNAGEAVGTSGHIRISTERWGMRTGDPAPAMILRVSDDGPGVSSEDAPRVFDALYTTKPGGTGLGLSTCRDIVAHLGGTIELDSAPGRGAVFTVTIPAEPDEAPLTLEQAAGRALNVGVGKHLLVVEDDPAVRSTMERSLEVLGFTVVTAKDRNEGVECLNSAKKIDVVISDVQVPGGTLDGFLRAVRERQSETPVLLISGDPNARPESGSLQNVVPAGVGFLGKPFNPGQLAAAIQGLLRPDPGYRTPDPG